MTRSCLRLAPVFFAAAALNACTSLDLLDTPAPPGMTVNGEYPSLGKPLTPATTQMSDEDAAAMAARLDALAASRNAGTMTEEEYQRKLKELQKLAKDAQSEPATQN